MTFIKTMIFDDTIRWLSCDSRGFLMCTIETVWCILWGFWGSVSRTPHHRRILILILLAIHKNWNRLILGVVLYILEFRWKSNCADMDSISTTISDFWEYRGTTLKSYKIYATYNHQLSPHRYWYDNSWFKCYQCISPLGQSGKEVFHSICPIREDSYRKSTSKSV